MNIKLQYFHDHTIRAYLEVLPVRPAHIPEKKLGKIVAREDPGFYKDDDGKFYQQIEFVDKICTVTDLRLKQQTAQENFSMRIDNLRKELRRFKLLKEITEETED